MEEIEATFEQTFDKFRTSLSTEPNEQSSRQKTACYRAVLVYSNLAFLSESLL